MTKINVKIVGDSLSPQGDRLTSVLVVMPRIIIAEMNTHRMLSKNTSSSRAIPFKKMVEAVKTNPFIPIAWQKHHSGMQGNEYLTGDEALKANNAWVWNLKQAIDNAKFLNSSNVTKQLCNRLLEPYMWTTMLITGSKEGWDNFFELRCPAYEFNGNVYKSKKDVIESVHKPFRFKVSESEFIEYKDVFSDKRFWQKINKGQAEIHMMTLAEAIYDAMNESTPKQLQPGQWHIPFEDKMDIDKIEEILISNLKERGEEYGTLERIKWKEYFDYKKVQISTAMAARTSYTVIGDEKEVDYLKLIKLHDRLIAQDPPHCFTEGTEILTNEGWKDFRDLTKEELVASVNITNGKFLGFEKPTSFIEEEYEGKVYTYKNKNIDISVTPNHKLLCISVSKSSDRSRGYETLEIIEPQTKLSETKTIGEREMIMFSAPKEVIVDDLKQYKEGELLGFFLGDGSARYKNSIRFRLKKERKKSYIINLLKDLGINYTINLDSKGIYNIKADIGDYTIYYDEDYNKRIPENILNNIINHVDFIAGLFEGLKNSDGSIKRNTWVYDTFSTPLKDNILFLCPLIGLTGVENPSYKHHRISFLTNNRILINDSRKPESKVSIEDYKGKIYCVETPSHGIIVRKNGKVLITHNSSPMEHCAQAMDDLQYYSFIKGDFSQEIEIDIDGFINISTHSNNSNSFGWCRNFKGFIPYRHIIENNLNLNL